MVMLPTAGLSGAMEILGWSARLWSSQSPSFSTPFEIQITATILAPTPLVAANFVILGRVIERLGPSYSRLSPRWYSIVFCTCDVVSLVIQAVGGGMAASADTNQVSQENLGSHIMLAGIAFQMATITVFVICGSEFFIRYIYDIPLRLQNRKGAINMRLKTISAAIAFSTTCLFIRSVYRTVELSGGWNGKIISTQRYFIVLDAVMVIFAMFTVNFVHPGLFIPPLDPRARDVIPLNKWNKNGERIVA